MTGRDAQDRQTPKHRRMEILETAIQSGGRLKTRDLAARLDVGLNLLAHDLNALVELGLVERGHGWVAARRGADDLFAGTEFASRQKRQAEKKQGIAEYIAGELESAGDVVLDAGSTALAVAERLGQRGQPIDLFTSNVAAVMRLAAYRSVTCHLAAGRYSHSHAATTGAEAASSIEGRRFAAGVLTPRAVSVAAPEVAQSEAIFPGPATRAAIEALARRCGVAPAEVEGRSLFLCAYSSDATQAGYKATLAKNASRLFIAAHDEKLFGEGAPLLTLILSNLVAEKPALRPDEAAQRASRQPLILPVRSRSAVRVRRSLDRGANAAGDPGGLPGVDAPIDLRDPESVRVVTSTDDDDRVPQELERQLRALVAHPGSEALLEVARSAIVVVSRDGTPVDPSWITGLRGA